MFFPEASPWSRKTIEANAFSTQNHTMGGESEVSMDNRVYEKTKTIKVGASIGASILGGLLKVTGSASYMHDTAIEDNEVNVALWRSSRAYFETLPSDTEVDYPEECAQDTAYTHVVTQVTYGMDTFFSFKNKVQNRTTTDEVGATLKATISLIIAIVDAEIGFNLTVRQEEVLNHTTLQMFGDFSPSDPNQPLPTNLTQAYHFWKKLPELEGSMPDWEGTSIVEVVLAPIKDITGCSGSPTTQDINEALLEQVNNRMDEIEQLLQRVGGLGWKACVRTFALCQRSGQSTWT